MKKNRIDCTHSLCHAKVAARYYSTRERRGQERNSFCASAAVAQTRKNTPTSQR
jgi:hypothetical protein